MSFNLNVSDNNIVAIINAIQDSLIVGKEKKDETHLFDNGHGIRKWGYIYEHMYEKEIEGFVSIFTERSGWKLALKFDPLNKTLFSLLSVNNLEIKQKQKSDVLHYISALSSVFNTNFEEKLSDEQKQEMQLSLNLDHDSKQAEEICVKMLGDLNVEVEQFCVLTLDIVNYELVGIYANVLNENFDVLYTEDWSNNIQISSIADDYTEHQAQETQQHDMQVTLKRQHKKKQNE
jgi:hypothetical protein